MNGFNIFLDIYFFNYKNNMDYYGQENNKYAYKQLINLCLVQILIYNSGIIFIKSQM